MERRGTSAYAAELVGTFMLVLFVVLVVAVYAGGGGSPDLVAIGLVHAFVLMMLVATLGGASGAHFNPAVTIALCAVRKIAPVDAAIYILVQLAGAVIGVLVAKALLQNGSGDAVNFGAVGVSKTFLQGKGAAGFLGEFIGTFMLMWAIMGAAVNPTSDKAWAPFIIGATLGFIVMVLAPMTGGGFNPARAFGPALISGEFGPAGTFLLAYIVAPVLAAVAAALTYDALVLKDRVSLRPIDKLGSPEA
ncbi:MAG: glycerol uptake facilitator protein [Solirubrobacteraceae bacterium]|jgi:MIP family channel proteins|nr:glycerol uptake facilitator protein [Solirubrobacteraceae bacterium]